MITDPTAASGDPAGEASQAARSEIPRPATPATTPLSAAQRVCGRVGRGRSTSPWSVAHDPFTTGSAESVRSGSRGSSVTGMRLRCSSLQACGRERLAAELTRPVLLCRVAWPMLTFTPVDPPVLEDRWALKPYVFVLRVGRPDRPRRAHDRPAAALAPGRGVARRRATARSSACGTTASSSTDYFGMTRYADVVEVRAGVLTPVAWAFAQVFYRHRQRRLNRLVARGAARAAGTRRSHLWARVGQHVRQHRSGVLVGCSLQDEVRSVVEREGVIARTRPSRAAGAMARLRRPGELVSVLPGVYAAARGGGRPSRCGSPPSRRWAPDAVLTGATAAQLTFWPTVPGSEIECAVRWDRDPQPGFRFARRTIAPELVARRSGVQVPARASRRSTSAGGTAETGSTARCGPARPRCRALGGVGALRRSAGQRRPSRAADRLPRPAVVGGGTARAPAAARRRRPGLEGERARDARGAALLPRHRLPRPEAGDRDRRPPPRGRPRRLRERPLAAERARPRGLGGAAVHLADARGPPRGVRRRVERALRSIRSARSRCRALQEPLRASSATK